MAFRKATVNRPTSRVRMRGRADFVEAWSMRAVLAALLCFSAGVNAWANGPDKPVKPIKEKTVAAELHITRYTVEEGVLQSAELVWVPEAAASACLGATPKECIQIVQEKRYQPNLIGRIALEMGQKIHFRPPKRLLSAVLSRQDAQPTGEETEQLLDRLQRLPELQTRIAKEQGEQQIGKLMAKFTVRARVRWTLWPNGEQFQVLDLPSL